jgi:hypothetical protein
LFRFSHVLKGISFVTFVHGVHARPIHSPIAQDTFEAYLKASGHGTEAKALAAHDKYGLNRCDVGVPPFGLLLKEHLMAPFFCFQVSGVRGRVVDV